MENKTKTLTLDEAYDAMVDYLDKYYQKTKSGDIASLIDGMSFVEDGRTADPAALGDWNQSVCKIKNQTIQNIGRLTIKEAYDTMIDDLDGYRDRINSDEVATLLTHMIASKDKKPTNPAWNDWLNSIDKILNQNPRIRPRFILTKPDNEE